MDMNCRKCREPWDWDYIRGEVIEEQALYEKMEKSGGYVKDNYDNGRDPVEIPPISLLRIGHKRTKSEMEALANWQFSPGPYILQCPACMGRKVELDEAQKTEQEIEQAFADILGGDIDGFMAEIEDLEGLMDFVLE